MFRFLPIILSDHWETALLRRFKVRCSLLLLLFKANLFQLYRCLVAAQIGKALCQHLAMNFELMFVFKTMPCACFVHSPVALEYRCCLGLLALCGSLYFLTKSRGSFRSFQIKSIQCDPLQSIQTVPTPHRCRKKHRMVEFNFCKADLGLHFDPKATLAPSQCTDLLAKACWQILWNLQSQGDGITGRFSETRRRI